MAAHNIEVGLARFHPSVRSFNWAHLSPNHI